MSFQGAGNPWLTPSTPPAPVLLPVSLADPRLDPPPDDKRNTESTPAPEIVVEEVPLPSGFETATRPLQDLSVDIRPSAGVFPSSGLAVGPREEPIPGDLERPWLGTFYPWQSAALCHGPLYFQEVRVERYGDYCPCLQPVLSGAHFFGRVPLLPAAMLYDCPCDCVYTLGYGRPGTPAPYRPRR